MSRKNTTAGGGRVTQSPLADFCQSGLGVKVRVDVWVARFCLGVLTLGSQRGGGEGRTDLVLNDGHRFTWEDSRVQCWGQVFWN